MKNEKYNEIFAECFADLETFEKVAIHNNYVTEGDGYGDEIFENTESFINESFSSPFGAINSLARYSVSDEWAWIDDLGNLYSADGEYGMEFSNVDEMAEYYFENPSYLKDIRGMSDWYDAVEYGLEEEDEEEEEEDEEEE